MPSPMVDRPSAFATDRIVATIRLVVGVVDHVADKALIDLQVADVPTLDPAPMSAAMIPRIAFSSAMV